MGAEFETRFGIHSQLQWIIDTDRDGSPDLRVNFGDVTDLPRPADYNGDGRSDFAVLREVGDQWEWIVDTNRNGRPDLRRIYGQSTDYARPADYDGDGATDFAVLRDVDDRWEWIIDTDRDGTPDIRKLYGNRSDRPRPADYDGDGASDFAVLRDVAGQWEWIIDFDRSGTPDLRVLYGESSDFAKPADYNGDGATDLAVLRKVGGQWEWIVDYNLDGAPDFRHTYGDTTDFAKPADFGGDGGADLAVVRNVGGQWEWIVDRNADGAPDLREIYGDSSDFVRPGDYDGDGASDLAVVRKAYYINGPAWPQLESTVDSLVMDHLRDKRIPGATVAISKYGRLILSKGYGFRSSDSKIPILPYHRTKIGSVSKVITALGAMRLTEQVPGFGVTTPLYGRLGALSDPDYSNAIAQNIAAQNDPHPIGWFNGLTLAHLLSHSAGFGAAEEVETTAAGLGIPLADLTYKQVHVNFLNSVPLIHEPGTQAPYNNHHLGVVGHIVETVSNQSYGDYIAQNILDPLGLNHMGFEDGVVTSGESYAHSYAIIHYGDDTDIARPADYDGDGRADFAVTRDVDGQWEWIIDTDRDGSPDIRTTYGDVTDIPHQADYDGDGATDFAVLREVDGKWEWIIDTDRNGIPNIREIYGEATDRPRPADYDGDGATDFAVLRNVGGQWEWIIDTDRDGAPEPALRKLYGNATDIAYPADYDGDGATDFGVLRDVGGKWEWIIDTDRDGAPEPAFRRFYGDVSDVPYPADYDGDGATDFAVLRDSNDRWRWIIDTDHNGVSNFRVNYGNTSDRPRPADYDGDGATDFAVLRKAGGQWQWYIDSNRDGASEDSGVVQIFDAQPNLLGQAAGGWMASAQDLALLMKATDSPQGFPGFLSSATLDLMEDPASHGLALEFPIQTFDERVLGWKRQANGALSHDGALGGGSAFMIKYGQDTDPLDGVDVRGINVAVLFNINNGDDRGTLVNAIAKASAQVQVASDYDLFGSQATQPGGQIPGLGEQGVPSASDNPFGVSDLLAYAFGIRSDDRAGSRSPLPVVSPNRSGGAEIRFSLPESPPTAVRLAVEKSFDLRRWVEVAALPPGGGSWEAEEVSITSGEDGRFEIAITDPAPGRNAHYRVRAEVTDEKR